MTDSGTIRANFPFPVIPREPGLLDHQRINEVHSKVQTNASSIASELGGLHGLMGLTFVNATYHQITGNYFKQPVNPGLLPINVTGTSAQISE